MTAVNHFEHDVAIVSSESGDWQGLYVDGYLATEKSSLSVEDICYYLGITVRHVTADMGKLEELGGCPRNLKDVLTA